jgi:hypothetical protein
MKVAVIQSNYLPWRGYFDIINDVDLFCFYDEVQYTKNDWRNRNRIKSKNGLQWLSIPVNKTAVHQKISEVLLPDEWQKEHNKILTFAYGRAPFFNQLKVFMNDFYIDNSFDRLSEFNQYSIQKIAKYIGVDTPFVNSAHYNAEGGRIERLLDLLTKLGATEYISGPSAKAYLSDKEHLFDEKGIVLKYKDYGNYPIYNQLGESYDPYISVIDLIANVAKEDLPKYIWKR